MNRFVVMSAALAAWMTPMLAQAEDKFAVDFDVGSYHACLVTSCGEVECWGLDNYGQAATQTYGPATLWGSAPYEEVTVGRYHSCALDGDNHVRCWGDNRYGQTTVPRPDWFNQYDFRQIDAGDYHTCGVTTHDDVICWGYNGHSRTTPPAGIKFESVSAGAAHTCAIEEDGVAVRCWGNASYGRTSGGIVNASETEWNAPFSQVSAGTYHTCARSGGHVHCWGGNQWGQVNDPMLFDPPSPGSDIYATTQSGYIDLSAGAYGTCAVNEQQSNDPGSYHLYCWGYQMGLDDKNKPEPLHEPDVGTEDVAWGTYAGCWMNLNDQVQCWGNDFYGVNEAPILEAECDNGFFEPVWPPFG